MKKFMHGARDHGAGMRAAAEAMMPDVMGANGAGAPPAPPTIGAGAPVQQGPGGMKRGGVPRHLFAKGGSVKKRDQEAEDHEGHEEGGKARFAKGGFAGGVKAEAEHSQGRKKDEAYKKDGGRVHKAKVGCVKMAIGGAGKERKDMASKDGAPKSAKVKFRGKDGIGS